VNEGLVLIVLISITFMIEIHMQNGPVSSKNGQKYIELV